MQNFVLKGIKVNGNDAISFFRPIKNLNLITGLKNKVQDVPIRNKLKKDKQASDSLIGKEMLPEEIHASLLRPLPLALSGHFGKLQKSVNDSFKNYLIS